jgi:hypothetical protein
MAKNNDALIAALLRERAGYVARDMSERVTQVDEQLRAYGYKSDSEETRKNPPVARTAERPRETTARPEVSKGQN